MIPQRNLESALAHHTRAALEDGWACAASASAGATTIFVRYAANVLVIPDVGASRLARFVGASVLFTSGYNIGFSTTVKSVTSSDSTTTVTLSDALPADAADGDTFCLYADAQAAQSALTNPQASGPSTTSALAGSASFVSGRFSLAGYSRITGSVYADQASKLQVEQSSDGTDYDVSSTFQPSASVGFGFSVEVVAPYGRIVLTNSSSTAQTVLRLYSFLRAVN